MFEFKRVHFAKYFANARGRVDGAEMVDSQNWRMSERKQS